MRKMSSQSDQVSNLDPAGMMMYRKKVKRSLSPKREGFLCDDLIVEILSYLPVKSVLRFKCVCKAWKIITQGKSFIQKHMSRSKSQIVFRRKSKTYNGNEEIFIHNNYNNGLVLEKSLHNIPNANHRIRNPATKQVLEVVKNPNKREDLHELRMGFVSSTSTYKLFGYYWRIGIPPGDVSSGIKILTVGTDLAWRPLDILFTLDRRARYWVFLKDVVYIISLRNDKLEKTEIVRLELEDESFMSIKIPPGFQYGRGHLFQAFNWDEKMSLGFILKEELHVWVLENYKKQIWSEKRIITLNFIKDYHPNMNLERGDVHLCRASKSRLLFYINNRRIELEYDIDSKKQSLFKAPKGYKIEYNMVPCLVSLKGMHYEDINCY